MVESLGTRPFLQTVMNYLQRTGKYFLNSLRAWLPNRQNIQKHYEPLFTWHFTVPSGCGCVCMASFSQELRTVAFFEFLLILQQLKPFQTAVNESFRDTGLSWKSCTIPQVTWVKIPSRRVKVTVSEGCPPYRRDPRQHLAMWQSKRHRMGNLVFPHSWLLGTVEFFFYK